MTTAEPTYQHAAGARELARRLWQSLEVIHTPVYFSSAIAAAGRAIGLSDRMVSYTAPLAAAWASVPWGGDPRLVLWQAATRSRSRADPMSGTRGCSPGR